VKNIPEIDFTQFLDWFQIVSPDIVRSKNITESFFVDNFQIVPYLICVATDAEQKLSHTADRELQVTNPDQRIVQQELNRVNVF
jgi:hypothetical protein